MPPAREIILTHTLPNHGAALSEDINAFAIRGNPERRSAPPLLFVAGVKQPFIFKVFTDQMIRFSTEWTVLCHHIFPLVIRIFYGYFFLPALPSSRDSGNIIPRTTNLPTHPRVSICHPVRDRVSEHCIFCVCCLSAPYHLAHISRIFRAGNAPCNEIVLLTNPTVGSCNTSTILPFSAGCRILWNKSL
jgi:hypothetical protein